VPGGTPYEAYTAFVQPLAQALACVARAKITCSPGGKNEVGVDHSWTLNRDAGANLSGGFTLHARMNYRIIEDDAEGMGPYRVTTIAYDYAMDDRDGAEVFAVHWHPASKFSEPHIHLGKPIADAGLLGKPHHLPTPRMTFEQVIRWAIEVGVSPVCEDWDARLALAEGPHKSYRTWA
jgi:hypothetical protein